MWRPATHTHTHTHTLPVLSVILVCSSSRAGRVIMLHVIARSFFFFFYTSFVADIFSFSFTSCVFALLPLLSPSCLPLSLSLDLKNPNERQTGWETPPLPSSGPPSSLSSSLSPLAILSFPCPPPPPPPRPPPPRAPPPPPPSPPPPFLPPPPPPPPFHFLAPPPPPPFSSPCLPSHAPLTSSAALSVFILPSLPPSSKRHPPFGGRRGERKKKQKETQNKIERSLQHLLLQNGCSWFFGGAGDILHQDVGLLRLRSRCEESGDICLDSWSVNENYNLVA